MKRVNSLWLAIVGVIFLTVVGALATRETLVRQRESARQTAAKASALAEAVRKDPIANEAPPRLVRSSITNYRRTLVTSRLPPFNAAGEVEVPFTRFATERLTARLLVNPSTLGSALEIAGRGRIAFARPGVPLKIVDLPDGRVAVFLRETFSGRLWLYRVTGTTVDREIQVKGPVDAEPILREAVMHRGNLHAILYDNERGVNEVVILDPDLAEPTITPRSVATLPTLDDPAGTHYEMMPTLFMLSQGERMWIVGGTLVSLLAEKGLAVKHRLTTCIRAQEVVLAPAGPVVMCLARTSQASAFELSRWSQPGQIGPTTPLDGTETPFRLRMEAGQIRYDKVKTVADLATLLRHDLERNQVSGVMELGSNNLEGRIAWSQIYFLNGLLDLVLLSRTDNDAFDRFSTLVTDAKRRLDIEMSLLDRLMETEIGFQSKSFTVKRQPALFAVQTARLLLLFDRYRREIEEGASLRSYAKLRSSVLNLDGHIDKLLLAPPGSVSPSPGRHYLAWPKGSAFYFDGLNVPYNHQNEWAYAVLETLRVQANPTTQQRRLQSIAAQIINHFIEGVANDGQMPRSGEWPYWWGQAENGWTAAQDVSVNTKTYPGDKSKAFISFRSIDAMAVLAAETHSSRAASPRLVESMHRLVTLGHVYPFVAASFTKNGYRPALEARVARNYARLTSPWDLQSAVWALLDLPADPAPEDPNSLLLNARVLAALPGIRDARPHKADAANVLHDYLAIAIPYNVELARLHQGLELGGKLLAWNLAYDLDAAVAAYERTHDIRLERLIELGLDAAMSMRDDRVGRFDDIRRRVMPAWGSNRYSPEKKEWVAWDAFTGAITHPAIIYANLVQSRSTDPARRTVAARYLADSITAINAFDPWWRKDAETQAGWYLDPLYQDVAPLNHMNLLGLAHIELCTRYRSQTSCEKAAGLAEYFKSSLKHATDGTCSWEYWAGAFVPKHRSDSGEDVTHAHLNVRFAHLAWRNGIVIEKPLIKCMARTLRERVMRQSGDWAMGIDGRGELIGSKQHEGLSAWMVLEDVDPTVRAPIEAFMLSRPNNYPLGLLSYATGPASFARRLPATAPPGR